MSKPLLKLYNDSFKTTVGCECVCMFGCVCVCVCVWD